MIVVVTGVAGAGKTTIGSRVADRLGWPYLEADELHPASNRRKMARGRPLDESDRDPWLEAMAAAIRGAGEDAVASCSCLRKAHRDRLRRARPDVRFVHLAIDPDRARSRLADREDHVFGADLVESQFEALERPREALRLDSSLSPEKLVDAVVAWVESGAEADPGA